MSSALPLPYTPSAAVGGSANGAGYADPQDGLVYVYALMPAAATVDLPAEGVDGQCAVERIAVGLVSAVISRVDQDRFGEAAVHAGLQNRTWLATHALAHQLVLDALVRSGEAVIPMRFCTIYPGPPALIASLEHHGEQLAAELARVAGKLEWGVKQMVDTVQLKAAITAGHPTLAGVAVDANIEKLRTQIAGMSPGAAFLLKKRLDNLVAERAQSVAFAMADATFQSLSLAAVESMTGDLPDDRPDVVLNAAFWVANDQYDAFVARLEELAAAFAPLGVHYDLSGPWPPHHFLKLVFDQNGAAT